MCRTQTREQPLLSDSVLTPSKFAESHLDRSTYKTDARSGHALVNLETATNQKQTELNVLGSSKKRPMEWRKVKQSVQKKRKRHLGAFEKQLHAVEGVSPRKDGFRAGAALFENALLFDPLVEPCNAKATEEESKREIPTNLWRFTLQLATSANLQCTATHSHTHVPTAMDLQKYRKHAHSPSTHP